MALGVPRRLRPRIISTFSTTRVVGHQPYALAAFTPREIRKVGCCTDIHFRRGGNMVHIRSEVLNYYVVSTYCVYIALIVVKLSYELT